MKFELPDIDELKCLASGLNLPLDERKAGVLLEYLQPLAAGYEYIDLCEDELPVSPWGGRDYRYPRDEENPFGAWLLKCHIKGAPAGPLSRRKVAVKDNIFVADLPLTNGSGALDGLVADFDAASVDKLLNAGADVVGMKATRDVVPYRERRGSVETRPEGRNPGRRPPGDERIP